MRSPRCPPQGNPSIDSGRILLILVFLFGASLITILSVVLIPNACSVASSIFPIVALSAHVCSSGCSCLSQLNANSVWLPRLLPINSCHSSRITVCNPINISLAFRLLSSTHNDSGVVTKMSGGFLSCLARSDVDVSPFLVPTRIGHCIALIGS